jgi:hypothetical protein
VQGIKQITLQKITLHQNSHAPSVLTLELYLYVLKYIYLFITMCVEINDGSLHDLKRNIPEDSQTGIGLGSAPMVSGPPPHSIVCFHPPENTWLHQRGVVSRQSDT